MAVDLFSEIVEKALMVIASHPYGTLFLLPADVVLNPGKKTPRSMRVISIHTPHFTDIHVLHW